MYKLINLKTKEEHLCDKVTIGEFDYYVSDDKILNGDHCVHPTTLNISQHSFDNNLRLYWEKIIATNNPNIDIPKVVDNVEKLAWDIIINDSSLVESKEQIIGVTAFYEGYNKSQETHPFNEEDMIDFADWKGEHYFVQNDNCKWTSELLKFSGCVYTTKELFKLWKEQQLKIVYYE